MLHLFIILQTGQLSQLALLNSWNLLWNSGNMKVFFSWYAVVLQRQLTTLHRQLTVVYRQLTVAYRQLTVVYRQLTVFHKLLTVVDRQLILRSRQLKSFLRSVHSLRFYKLAVDMFSAYRAGIAPKTADSAAKTTEQTAYRQLMMLSGQFKVLYRQLRMISRPLTVLHL